MEPATLTVPEAGRLLGVSRNTAYAAAARGDLPVVRVGRRVLIPRQRLLDMLGAASEVPAASAANKLAGVAAGEVGGSE
jgi:excisionase family DNA binding protein